LVTAVGLALSSKISATSNVQTAKQGRLAAAIFAFMSIGPALEALAQWGAENVFQNRVVFDIPDNDGVPQ